MTDINKVVLLGRLTRDGELSYTRSGYPILKMALAVNRGRKQNDKWVEEASFFEANLWGKRAESLRPYLIKGQQVAIDGALRQERWESPDGDKRSKIVIDVSDIQLVGSKKAEDSRPAEEFAKTVHETAQKNADRDFDDDIPF